MNNLRKKPMQPAPRRFVWSRWPLIIPGIISGFLMAFTISLDDFIIINFVRCGGVETLPKEIFGSAKTGIKPNIRAIYTLLSPPPGWHWRISKS